MNWIERKLEDESSLIYRFQIATIEQEPPGSSRDILMASFEGSWRNADGSFINAICNAAVGLWLPDAIILDFRLLGYRWGDEMGMALNVGSHRFVDDPDFPLAIVVSDLCREGMTSLLRDDLFLDPAAFLFESVDAAVAALAPRDSRADVGGGVPLP